MFVFVRFCPFWDFLYLGYYPHTSRDLASPSCRIFTDSALWAGSVVEFQCPFVCVFVMSQNTQFRMSWRPLVKEWISIFCLWWSKRGPFTEIAKVHHFGPAGELEGDGLWLWLLAVCTSMALRGHFHGKKPNIDSF